MGEGVKPPTELAKRFEAYRPTQFALAVGDRVRITAGGKTKDGKHRLSNGSLLTVQGFTKRGDIIVDHGWVIDRDFGHLTHGYVVTSHASQGVTVDKVFIGMSSESFPATYQRTAYVAVTRGQGTGADFHGRPERTAEGDQPAGRSAVGDGAFRGDAAETDVAGSADEAAGVRPWCCRCGSGETPCSRAVARDAMQKRRWTMTDDKPTHQERLQAKRSSGRASRGLRRHKETEAEGAEASCAAFGYLRGIRDQAAAVEFRFRDGNSMWFPYGWLGTWQYNPSEGLLLKFSGDLVYLVLIRGSNLDRPLNEGAINLTHAGLQRHRVLWVREMTEEEIRQVGETGPTIDSIEVAEFESHAALKEWLSKNAPAFVQCA